MTENLEELKPEGEEITPTPGAEGEEPTTPKEEPTLGKTYDQKQLDEAVGKGVSSIQSQLTLSKAEAERERSLRQASEQEIQEREREHQRELEELASKLFADDPDSLTRYKDTKAAERERAEAKRLKAEAEADRIEADGRLWAMAMKEKHTELHKIYDIPQYAEKILDRCLTTEEMEDIAKEFPTIASKAKEPAKKFDSGVGGGVTEDFSKISFAEGAPSGRDMISKGLSKKK